MTASNGKIIDLAAVRAAREEEATLNQLKHQFVTEILPRMTPEDRLEMAAVMNDPAQAEEAFSRILFRVSVMQALDKLFGGDKR